jgi:hypothetical protein
MLPCSMLSSQTSLSPDPHPHFSTLPLPSVNSVPSALKSLFAASPTHRSPLVFAGVRIDIIPWDSFFLCFHTLTHSFAPCNPATPFRSIGSALFAQNTRGGGRVVLPLLLYPSVPHSNARNSFPLMLLRHDPLDSPGGGHMSQPSSARHPGARLYLVTSLPPYFSTSSFIAWNNSLSRTSSQVQR